MFFDTFANRLTIKGALVAKTAVRIGAGRATEPVGTDLPVVRDGRGCPYIPGSSLKGVLRTTAEQVARAAADLGGACLPTGDESGWCISGALMKTLKGQAHNDAALAQLVWDRTCLTCQTFGSPWLASHVKVKDLSVVEATWFGQFQVRDGVAIDRDKGTVAEKKLYDYEVVPAGTRFALEIVVENAEPWQRGLVWLALQPFMNSGGAVGGFTSRGLGWMVLDALEVLSIESEPDPTALIDALLGQPERLVGPALKDRAAGWLGALRTELIARAGKEA